MRRIPIMVSSRFMIRSRVRLPSVRLRFTRTDTNFVVSAAGTRAETVFQPIVEARTKAERLKSTLGVFERSKFFFNLPTTLGEAVEEVSKVNGW